MRRSPRPPARITACVRSRRVVIRAAFIAILRSTTFVFVQLVAGHSNWQAKRQSRIAIGFGFDRIGKRHYPMNNRVKNKGLPIALSFRHKNPIVPWKTLERSKFCRTWCDNLTSHFQSQRTGRAKTAPAQGFRKLNYRPIPQRWVLGWRC